MKQNKQTNKPKRIRNTQVDYYTTQRTHTHTDTNITSFL